MKILTLLLCLALSTTIIAKPVSKDDLKKVNGYIAKVVSESETLSADASEIYDIKILDGDVNEEGKITGLKLNALITPSDGTLTVKEFTSEIKTSGNSLDVTGSFYTNILSGEELTMYEAAFAGNIRERVALANREGKIKISFSYKQEDKKFIAKFKVLPINQNDLDFKELNLLVTGDYKTGDFTLTVNGKLNASGANVLKVQSSLTNIFQALLGEQDPSEADFDALSEVLNEVLNLG